MAHGKAPKATFAEMLALLEPEELLIACLRLEDLSNEQIASLLDVSPKSVRSRMEQAVQRIVEALPELAPVLRGRRQPSRCGQRPLERGWICPSIASEPDLLIDSPPQGTEGGESSQDDSPGACCAGSDRQGRLSTTWNVSMI
jgi:DNA-binding CsgD family transcriptional regulator